MTKPYSSPRFIANYFNAGYLKMEVKLKNLKKDALLKLFKLTYQERYEHVGPEVTSLQDGEMRLCLVDDLKEHMAWQTDYCIMKEGMPILRGRESVPGMNSSERVLLRLHVSYMIKSFPMVQVLAEVMIVGHGGDGIVGESGKKTGESGGYRNFVTQESFLEFLGCSAMGTVFVVAKLLLDAEGIKLGSKFLLRSCVLFLASSRGIEHKSKDVLVVASESYDKNGGKWKKREAKGRKTILLRKYSRDTNPRKVKSATSVEKKGIGQEVGTSKKDNENTAKTLASCALVTLDLHAHTFLFEYIRVAKVLIVGYKHVVMNCGSAGNRQHDKSEPSSKSLDFEVLIVGYEHVVMNCGSAGI
nr:hypothetical protein [Tanacetum cinerariifolium]